MPALCPLPLDCSEVYGALTIGSTSLHTPAWCAFDLSELYDSPEFRLDNVLVETLPGRVARPGLDDETDYSLPMMFSGAVNAAGAPWAAPDGGLLANRRALHTALVEPIRSGTASLAASLVVPDPADPDEDLTFEFGCQPLQLTGWTLLPDGYARTVLRIRVPVPEFVENVA